MHVVKLHLAPFGMCYNNYTSLPVLNHTGQASYRFCRFLTLHLALGGQGECVSTHMPPAAYCNPPPKSANADPAVVLDDGCTT